MLFLCTRSIWSLFRVGSFTIKQEVFTGPAKGSSAMFGYFFIRRVVKRISSKTLISGTSRILLSYLKTSADGTLEEYLQYSMNRRIWCFETTYASLKSSKLNNLLA